MHETATQRSVLEGVDRRKLGAMLIARGVITQRQLEEALRVQRRHGHEKLLGELLVELGMVSEEDVLSSLAEAYDLPFIASTSSLADPKIIDVLPRKFIDENGILPLFLVREVLTVAVSEPANLFLIEEINRQSEHTVQLVVAAPREIQSTLHSYLPSAQVFVQGDMHEDHSDAGFRIIERSNTEPEDLKESALHSPIVHLVEKLIIEGVREGASDIHIETDDQQFRVRYRIDGQLLDRFSDRSESQPAIVSRIKILSNLDISERRVPQDGDFHVEIDGRQIDLRVSTMPGKFGEKVVIRIIDNRNTIVPLEKLGFLSETLAAWKEVIQCPNGVVLVTGPTGSGKSTTLYSVLSLLNAEEMNISTVEDPIEAYLPRVNQSQVNEKARFGFARALRAMLRQDPDVIMVGEIRDEETALVATQAALTGHLVYSTLHTNNAPSACTRLHHLGVEPYLVAATLRAVLGQRLVRMICPHCRSSFEPEEAMRHLVETMTGGCDVLYRGEGCGRCRNTGFSGRIGIFELLVPDEELLAAIADDISLQELTPHLERLSFQSLRHDGMAKAREGLTTVEEICRVTAT